MFTVGVKKNLSSDARQVSPCAHRSAERERLAVASRHARG
jgi:hypothetical protein